MEDTLNALLKTYSSNIEKLELLLETEEDPEYVMLYKNIIIENGENKEKIKKQYPEILFKN